MNTDLEMVHDSDGNALVPILPIEDEPQIADAQKTYIIYGYSENNDARNYEVRRGVVAFNIKARRIGQLGEITNTLSRAFENCDISAAQVNAWSSAYTGNIFHGIRFGTIETIYVEGGIPETDEGGPLHGLVNVAYEAIIIDNNFVLPSAAHNTLWG